MLNIEVVSRLSVLRRRTGQVIHWTGGVGCLHFMAQSADQDKATWQGWLNQLEKIHNNSVLFYLILCMTHTSYQATDWLGSCQVCTRLYPVLELTLLSSWPFSLCFTAKVNTQRWNTGRHCPEDRLNISINLKQVGLSSKHNKYVRQCLRWHLENLQTLLLLCTESECFRGRTAQYV